MIYVCVALAIIMAAALLGGVAIGLLLALERALHP